MSTVVHGGLKAMIDEGMKRFEVPSQPAMPAFLDGDVERYWDQISQWRDVSTKDFNSYSWQVRAF